MRNIFLIIICSVLSLGTSIANAATTTSIVIKNNQIWELKGNKMVQVTNRANIGSKDAETQCLKYLKTKKNNMNGSCIFYEIVAENINNKYAIFTRTELGSQEMISKEIYTYNFAQKKLANVTKKATSGYDNFQLSINKKTKEVSISIWNGAENSYSEKKIVSLY